MAGHITISTESMSFEYLDMLKKNNPAWRLLASSQAPFIASFLYREFIQVNQRQISEQELSSLLDDYISMLNEGTDENLFPRNGREYLSEWANDQHGWLRRFFPPGKDEPYYDITSLAQKAIDWLLSLKQQSFIGTESRLITVFELLHQILAGSEADPQRRLEELQRQKSEIEQEMSRVESGDLILLNDTQVKERFWQAISTAREIVSDFRAVEQNFRELDRELRERIATWNKGKGELLEEVFNEQDGIAQSEQGKSFSAFWKFLMSSASQEDFSDTLNRVLQLQPVREIEASWNSRNIHNDWVTTGAYVQETVAALSQQLRNYVDDNYIAEERRINQILREIEGKALSVRNDPPKVWKLEIDAIKPDIALALDRPLFTVREKPVIQEDIIDIGLEDIPVDALFTQIFVDKEKLCEKIDNMLQTEDSVTLSQVITQHPLEYGLSELITYFIIAGESSGACFHTDELEIVFWDDKSGMVRQARIPKTTFTRAQSKDTGKDDGDAPDR